MGQRREALLEFLKQEPGNSFLSYALALEYAKEGDLNLAVNTTNSLLIANPDYLGAYYQLGKWYEELGNTEQARMVFHKGIELARNQKQAKTEKELKEALFNLEINL